MVEQITDRDEKVRIAGKILGQLKEWFEVDDNREKYIHDSADRILIAAKEDGDYAGFLCLKETGKDTAELAVMGVLKEYHRKGLGRQLVEKAKETAASLGYSFMQVKTVQYGMYEDYDKTNLFYRACGFKEFEVFPDFWDADNPCQVYVMSLQ